MKKVSLLLIALLLSGCTAGTYHAQGTIIGFEVTVEPPGMVLGYRNFNAAFVPVGSTATTKTTTVTNIDGATVGQESTYGVRE